MSTAFVFSLAIVITKCTNDSIQSLTQQIIVEVCSRDQVLLTFVQDALRTFVDEIKCRRGPTDYDPGTSDEQTIGKQWALQFMNITDMQNKSKAEKKSIAQRIYAQVYTEVYDQVRNGPATMIKEHRAQYNYSKMLRDGNEKWDKLSRGTPSTRRVKFQSPKAHSIPCPSRIQVSHADRDRVSLSNASFDGVSIFIGCLLWSFFQFV